MTLDVDRVLSNPRMLRALTSLDRPEWERLLGGWTDRLAAFRQGRTGEGQPRRRAPGGGAKGKLPTAAHQLFFILFYYKCYPLQEVMGLLFGLSQGQVCTRLHQLAPILHATLGYEKLLPARQARSLERVLQECPALRELCVDGTERPVRRPEDKGRQQKNYSGKKKRHTLKNVLVTGLESGRVLYLSPTRPGSEHDKTIAERAELRLPAGTTLLQDGGFQGFAPAGVTILQPKRKPRGEEHGPWQGLINRGISALRVGVEHTIGAVKRCRIVADIFRNWRRGFADRVLVAACALHNLRCEMRAA